MRETDYATAVARVRANENYLLSTSDIDRLIAAKESAEAVSLLQEKGFLKAGEEINEALSNFTEKAVSLIREIAPKSDEFDFLIIKNDFHNLKAILKGIVTGVSFEKFLIRPNVTSPELIEEAIKEQKFDILPKYMAKVAEKAYNYFVTTSDGQLSDLCIDRGSLEAVIELSNENDNKFIKDLGEEIAALSNIRIAVRGAKTKQSEKVLGAAICETKTVSKSALISAALESVDAVADYILTTKYSASGEALKNSVSDFEKWCDNALIDYVSSARYSCFGPAPLAAYIIRCEAMQKTVRIILSAKETGLNESVIKQRVRNVF